MGVKYIIDNNDNTLTSQIVNGGLSATTLSATTITITSGATTGYVLTALDNNGNAGWQLPSSGSTFTGNTSGDCITDLYVSNVNSCSPLHIQNITNDNVLIGENGGVNVGIGTSSPTSKLEVKSDSSTGNTVYPFSINNVYDQKILYLSNQNAYADYNRLGVYSYIYDNQFKIDLAGSWGQFIIDRGNTSFQVNPYTINFNTRFLFKSDPSGTSGEAGILHIFNGNPNSSNGNYLISEDLQVGTPSGGTGSTIVGKYIRKSNFNNPSTTFYPLIALDGNVGIGTSSPTAKLHINNVTSGNTVLFEDDTNPDSSPFIIDYLGNVGIGTNNPSEKLDVTGKTKTTSLQVTSGATSGHVLTCIDSSGNTEWRSPLPYKIYIALLTQTGTTTPTSKVLEDTVGDITLGRISSGVYTISSSFIQVSPSSHPYNVGGYDSDNTVIFMGPVMNSLIMSPPDNIVYKVSYSANTITLYVMWTNDGLTYDEYLLNTPIEIRIYN